MKFYQVHSHSKQNAMCKHNINRVRQESPLEKMYVGNAILNEYVLNSFIEGLYSFRIFSCNRELIPDYWRSYRERSFADIELF